MAWFDLLGANVNAAVTYTHSVASINQGTRALHQLIDLCLNLLRFFSNLKATFLLRGSP